MFEEMLVTEHSEFETKVLNLLHTWEECIQILSSDICDGTHVFFHYAVG